MMKWRAFHREQAAVVEDGSGGDLGYYGLSNDADFDPQRRASSVPPDFAQTFHAEPSPGFTNRSPESLLISPNLKALIEQDEMHRRSQDTNPFLNKEYPSDFPVSLPPPPRGPRKSRTRSAQGSGQQTSHSSPNSSLPGALPSQDTSGPSSPETKPAPVIHSSAVALLLGGEDGTFSTIMTPTPPNTSSRDVSEANIPSDVQDEVNTITMRLHDSSDPAYGSFLNYLDTPVRPEIQGTDRSAAVSLRPEIQISVAHASTMREQEQLPRAFLVQKHADSRDSSPSRASMSSIEPASTAADPRISISSTIYPPSSYAYSASLPMPSAYSNRVSLTTSYEDDFPRSAVSPSDAPFDEERFSTSLPGTSRETHQSRTEPGQLESFFSSDDEEAEISFSTGRHLDAADSPPRSPSPPMNVKPPVPTTLKPIFNRSRPSSSRSSLASSPAAESPVGSLNYAKMPSNSNSDSSSGVHLPPTTNILNAQERADLLRKNRKLAQVFGEMPPNPTAQEMSEMGRPSKKPLLKVSNDPLPGFLRPTIPSWKNHFRGALSLSQNPLGKKSCEIDTTLVNVEGGNRRHSSPLSPITFSDSYFGVEDDSNTPPPSATSTSRHHDSDGSAKDNKENMPLGDDRLDQFMFDMARDKRNYRKSALSFQETINEGESEEVERRRMREKLAKLHRFLGSHVPPELVGMNVAGASLPDPAMPQQQQPHHLEASGSNPSQAIMKVWPLARRRNSISLAEFPSRLDKDDRLKEDLKGKEKAAVVRRAQKMEKMFGEQPPQTLYHSNTLLPERAGNMGNVKSAPNSPSTPPHNMNRSAYTKGKRRTSERPGTADSSRALLHSADSRLSYHSYHDDEQPITFTFVKEGGHYSPVSAVYMNYRHSLNSLTDIVDRDDRQSLARLHDYINSDTPEDDSFLEYITSSAHVERRRSLPSRNSRSSLASEFTLAASPDYKEEPSPFQQRRRRAAKLSHFFGVSYRDLFGDVLDSLEMGLKEDSGKGALQPDEVQDLMARLRTLRVRHESITR